MADSAALAELQIQAHEASLVRNQDSLAQTVEYDSKSCSTSAGVDCKGKGKIKTRLIRWLPQDDQIWLEDHSQISLGAEVRTQHTKGEGYWVDRLALNSPWFNTTILVS